MYTLYVKLFPNIPILSSDSLVNIILYVKHNISIKFPRTSLIILSYPMNLDFIISLKYHLLILCSIVLFDS